MEAAEVCIVEKIVNDCYDAHHDQDECQLLAYNKNSDLIGYLQYSIFENELYINMIESHKDCRRKGIATALMNRLEKDGRKIKQTLSTTDGTAFLKAYKKLTEDKWKKVTFPEKTVEQITWQALQDYKEFAQTLCIDNDGKAFLGGKPIYGHEHGVESPQDDFIYPGACEPRGEFAGRIHSHVEEHDERPPFDKGSSNVDIFGVAKEGLNHLLRFPRLECVASPTYNKQGWLNGVKIGCERFEQFTEDDIKKIDTGMIIGDKEEKFDEEDIAWIKGGIPPRSGMYARTGFMVRMANLKNGLEEDGFLSYDEFVVKGKREKTRRETKRLLCDFHDETLVFN